MVGGMDHTELTEKFLRDRVVTPVVLGIFAEDEWESVALENDVDDDRIVIARVVVCGEAVEVVLDYPGNTESVFEMQQRLVEEFKAFIERSEFGAHRTSESDTFNTRRTPNAVTRTPRPNFLGPSECTQRRRRYQGRVMRIDRRRCVSAHRRS